MVNEVKSRRVVARGREPLRSRPWPVTAVGLLLGVQTLAYLGYGILFLRSALEPVAGTVEWVNGISFVVLSILALGSMVSCLRWQYIAWQTALFVQGLSLVIALALYFFQDKAPSGYIMMLYSIFMVLYLNHHEVYVSFRPGSDDERRGDRWTS